MPNTLNERGFTLVELMIIVALLAIVATIAVPNFTQFIRNNQVQAKADELTALVQYARSQAVAARKTYELDLERWEVKAAGDSSYERKVEFNTGQASTNHNLGAGKVVSFTGHGMANPAAKISVCRAGDKDTGYLIDISASGMVKRYSRGYKDDSNKMSSCTSF
ncbi:MAG: GspH/FimT family pseudopilin [Thiopseudomonas sp.]|nr:GspH/FimT family pseudopilin [Thiopseudomonas sp.]MCK9466145.1 GspH/FimT family pseudopilin [Thiopseudomonas sp.]